MEISRYDFIIFGLLFGATVFVAVLSAVVRRKRKGAFEFLLGSGTVPLAPVVFSIFASFHSAFFILNTPVDTFRYGYHPLIFASGSFLAGWLSLFIFVPTFYMYPQRMTSIFEYIELRYKSRLLQILGSLTSVLWQLAMAGISLYGPSLVFTYYTDFDNWKIVVIIGALAIVPTIIGGIRGVVWTDMIQVLAMFGTVITFFIAGVSSSKNKSDIFSSFFEKHSDVSLSADPRVTYTLWSSFFGGLTAGLSTLGMSQATVQRYSSLPSYKQALMAVGLGNALNLLAFLLVWITGIVIYSRFVSADCLEIDNSHHLLPVYASKVLDYPAVSGLFLSALIAGGVSSATSSLTTIAANIWGDMIKPCGCLWSVVSGEVVMRATVLIAGILSILTAYIMLGLGGTVLHILVIFINAIQGPLIGLFLLAGFFRISEKIGATVGFGCGFVFNMWLVVETCAHAMPDKALILGREDCLARNITIPIAEPERASSLSGVFGSETISPHWFGLYGAIVTMLIGLVVSCITRCFCKPHHVSVSLLYTCLGRRCSTLTSEEVDAMKMDMPYTVSSTINTATTFTGSDSAFHSNSGSTIRSDMDTYHRNSTLDEEEEYGYSSVFPVDHDDNPPNLKTTQMTYGL